MRVESSKILLVMGGLLLLSGCEPERGEREPSRAAPPQRMLADGPGVPASTHGENLISAGALVTEAEVIFQGVVEAVGYRSSVSEETGGGIPHTFVSYRVDSLYKGRPATQDRLTLRFVGGEGEGSRILMASGVPLFDVGDRDILFVSGNGLRLCPLVDCARGRFRLIGDSVYTDDGRGVVRLEGDALWVGQPRPLEEVMTHDVAGRQLRRTPSDLRGESGAERGQVRQPTLSRGEFLPFLEGVIDRYHTQEELGRLVPVPSANIQDTFHVRIRPSPPGHS